jgi:hypothetical protein
MVSQRISQGQSGRDNVSLCETRDRNRGLATASSRIPGKWSPPFFVEPLGERVARHRESGY